MISPVPPRGHHRLETIFQALPGHPTREPLSILTKPNRLVRRSLSTIEGTVAGASRPSPGSFNACALRTVPLAVSRHDSLVLRADERGTASYRPSSIRHERRHDHNHHVAAPGRHRAAADPAGEQRAPRVDELQVLSETQGQSIRWSWPMLLKSCLSACSDSCAVQIKCNRLRPSCEACQVFQCPCIYGMS